MPLTVDMKVLLKNKISLLFLWLAISTSLLGQTNSDVQLANQLFSSGNYLKSSEIYSNLYKKYKSTNYYQKLLDCFIALDQMKAAEKLIKKHSKRYANNITVSIDFGHVYSLTGEEKKATKIFDEVLERLNAKKQYVSIVAKKFTK